MSLLVVAAFRAWLDVAITVELAVRMVTAFADATVVTMDVAATASRPPHWFRRGFG